MRQICLTFPELALVAGTRAALGAGLGLLLADRLTDDRRQAVGWTLVGVGLATSVPLALEVFGKRVPRGGGGDFGKERVGKGRGVSVPAAV